MKTKLIFFVISIVIAAQPCLAESASEFRDPFQTVAISANGIQADSSGKINLDFKEIKVRDALEMLAQYAKSNLIIDNSVQGSMTLHLHQVTWQQAFNTIISSQNLVVKENDQVIFVTIATSTHKMAMNNNYTLISLHYAKATDILAIIKNQAGNLLSKDGVITADPRTNKLWIQDNSQKLMQLRNLIAHLDVPLRQVLIKARIVNVDENYIRELGVKFGTVTNDNVTTPEGLNMDLPVAVNQVGHINLAIAKLSNNSMLDLELSALESNGHGKVISSPELMTADRTPAYIQSGEEVPYQEKTGNGNTSVAFKKAVLGLKVVPQITSSQHILLELTVNQDSLSSIRVHGVPAIRTREMQTQVTMSNGQTIVLGGVYEQSENHTVERVPFLGSLPVLGHLFSSKSINTDRRELLIFVTPQIIR